MFLLRLLLRARRAAFLSLLGALGLLLGLSSFAGAATVHATIATPSVSASTQAIIAGIGGLVVPPIVSLLKRISWPAQVKQLLAAVRSLGVAAVALAITAPSDFALPFLQLGALVYAATQVAYGAFFQGSTLDTVLTAIGNKPKPAPTTPPAAQ